MNSIKLSTTVQTPSAFGMPFDGRTFVATPVCGTGTTTSIVRDRVAMDVQGAITAGADLVFAARPGTTAWRPPNC